MWPKPQPELLVSTCDSLDKTQISQLKKVRRLCRITFYKQMVARRVLIRFCTTVYQICNSNVPKFPSYIEGRTPSPRGCVPIGLFLKAEDPASRSFFSVVLNPIASIQSTHREMIAEIYKIHSIIL